MRNIILLLILLAFIYTFFGAKREPNINELAYTWAAVASQSVEPCKKIGVASIKTYVFMPAMKTAIAWRSECYRSVAVATDNEDLCRYVVPVSRLRSWFSNGSGYNSELCIAQVKKSQPLSRHTLTTVLATRLMSSLYADNEIYQDCNHHFSTQRANISILKNTFHENYDQCVTRRTKSTNNTTRPRGLETDGISTAPYFQKVAEASFKAEEQCKDLHLHTTVEDYYFGKPADRYPRDREYAHCQQYCTIVEFDGYCEDLGDEISQQVYKQFLSSQARSGKLIQKLDQMPNYYFW